MNIAVSCPNCQSKYQVGADWLGKATNCKSCGQRFTLAVAADETLGTGAEGGIGKRSLPLDGNQSSGGMDKRSLPVDANPLTGESAPPQSGAIRIGRYEIRQRLGAGAFGTVYRAYDPVLDRDVALKVPQAAILDTPGACERFLREAKAAARLHHPHIVPVHDAGQDGSGVFIAAAFIEGQTLAAAIAAKPLDPSRAIDIVAKLADALHAAHQAGIVHRDVKPANVMLDRRGEPQLMDFGLAQVASASAQLTQKGMLLGTPCYMSPEQAMGESDEIGPASDQYALGVMLYELLCRRLPFEGPPLAVLYQVREKAPDPPRSIDPSIPPAVEAVCLRAMAKRSADRFADCRQLAQALRQVAGQAVAARPAPIPMAPRAASAPSGSAETMAQVSSVAPRIAAAWQRIARDRRMAIGAGVLGVLLVLGVVIVVKSRNGDVRIETDNPNARVTIDDGQITVDTTSADEPAAATPPAAADGVEPPPAIAPFDAEQAKEHQRKWAAYLGVPVEYENSIGMKFILIPPGEFRMGAAPDDTNALPDEVPQHQVRISQPMYLGIHEVTQEEYERVTGANPSFFGKRENLGSDIDTKRWPVEQVAWNDAVDFCQRLTALPAERNAGRTYRLPTEAEWEYACRAGTTATFTYGNSLGSSQANFNGAYQIPRSTTGPWLGRPEIVGKYSPNAFGLYDMLGNVWEWCGDSKRTYDPQAQTDPRGPDNGSRLNRGGGWISSAGECRSSHRRPDNLRPADRHRSTGLRVVCEVTLSVTGGPPADEPEAAAPAENSGSNTPHVWPTDAPAPAIAPFDAEQAKEHQRKWAAYLGVPVEWENTVGMKFRLIPPGEFLMGSTPEEIEEALVVAGNNEQWKEQVQGEGPQHKVILTFPIYVGIHEVTQTQYEQVTGATPSHFAVTGAGKDAVANLDTQHHPVETVSWPEAAEFCAKLSATEQLKPFYSRSGETVTMLDGNGYRLPTEAEWEFACRAGSTANDTNGEPGETLLDFGWYSSNSGGRTHAVGELKANPLGLFDMHGNVWEWVQDGWDPNYYTQFQEMPAIDPIGPFSASARRVFRGGRWGTDSSRWRVSTRNSNEQAHRDSGIGFRAALSVEAVRAAAQSSAVSNSPGTTADSNTAHISTNDAPAPAISPFDAARARQYQDDWAAYLKLPVEWENSLKMKFRLIPPGAFLMGSPDDEAGRQDDETLHLVRVAQHFFLAQAEVTQSQYEIVTSRNPSYFSRSGGGRNEVTELDTSDFPVEQVSWEDAQKFCRKLTALESEKPAGIEYRLPTEAEWEYACRAGSEAVFAFGDSFAYLNASISGPRPMPVKSYSSNAFGLFDMHGNVAEWCSDHYTAYPGGPDIDSIASSRRVLRGGGWDDDKSHCRAANRMSSLPQRRYVSNGFRVVAVVVGPLGDP